MGPKRLIDILTSVLHNVTLIANMNCVHTHICMHLCVVGGQTLPQDSITTLYYFYAGFYYIIQGYLEHLSSNDPSALASLLTVAGCFYDGCTYKPRHTKICLETTGNLKTHEAGLPHRFRGKLFLKIIDFWSSRLQLYGTVRFFHSGLYPGTVHQIQSFLP